MTLRHTCRSRLVLALLVVLTKTRTIGASVLRNNLESPTECTGSEYSLCGCQAIKSSALGEVQSALQQSVEGCHQLCGQSSCEQSCTTSLCTTPMGPDGLPCSTVVNAAHAAYIQGAACTYNSVLATYQCEGGNSVAYPDAPTHTAITSGSCIPACGVATASDGVCTFEARLREETYFDEGDLPEMPFHTIQNAVYTDPLSTPDDEGDESEEFDFDFFADVLNFRPKKKNQFAPLQVAPAVEGGAESHPAEEEKQTSEGKPSPASAPAEVPDVEPYPSPSGEPELEPLAPPSEEPDVEPMAPPSEMPEPEPEVEPAPEPEPEVEPVEEPDVEPEVEPVEQPDVEPEEGPAIPPETTESLVAEFERESGEFHLYLAPYTYCHQVCRQAEKIMLTERSITCRDYAGIPVELTKCDLSNYRYSLQVDACDIIADCGPDYYFVLSEWSECSANCAAVLSDGTILPKKATRDYECKSLNGTTADKSNCESLIAELQVPLERNCNSVPCVRYWYAQSDWTSCDCETWTQTRRLTCTNWNTGASVEDTVCSKYGLEPPLAVRYCMPEICIANSPSRKLKQTEPFDFCSHTNCSTHGTCDQEQCVCEDGYKGPECEIDTRGSSGCAPPQLLDGKGECCSSGVFDLSGKCCDGANSKSDVDIDGHCCVGSPLDGCGKCAIDVQRFLDAANQCCEALDASGTCCESGDVDECGVCDGMGASCATYVEFRATLPDASARNGCQDDLKRLVEEAINKEFDVAPEVNTVQVVESFVAQGIPYTTGFIHSRIETLLLDVGASLSCEVDEILLRKESICGNDICEIGESSTCAGDCDYAIQECPMELDMHGRPAMCSGHGLCSFANSSECFCNAGYTGSDCADCAKGFFHVGADQRCIPAQVISAKPTVRITALEVTPAPPLTKTVAEEEFEDEGDDDHVDSAVVVAATGISLLTFCCCALWIVFLIWRKSKEEETEPSEEESLNQERESDVAET